MMDWLPWTLAGAGLAVSLALIARLRALSLESASSRLEAEKLGGELQATRAQLEKASGKLRRSGDELSELRKKLDKTKRRAAQPSGSATSASPSRQRDLEAELEQARQARDAAREEASGVALELRRVRAELAESRSEPPPPAPPRLDEEAIAALEQSVAQAEAKLAEASAQLEQERKNGRRLASKLKTQDSLYLAIRGDLAAKKDRLRTQQEEIERLQAFKVAVLDPLPPSHPARIEVRSDVETAGAIAQAEGSDEPEPTP